MKTRTAIIYMALLALPLASGCPGQGNSIVGTWVISYAGLDRGLELLPNGQAEPFTIDTLIAGTVTWQQDGDRVVLYQDLGTDQIVWAAVLTSESAMAGYWIEWKGNNVGNKSDWSAVKQ